MVNISDEFKKLSKKQHVDYKLLVPLMTWVSGSRANIDKIQKINRKLLVGNHKIYILELIYNSNITNFLRYPKINKLDDDNKQYIEDLAKYFNWSKRELYKNLSVVDIESSKEEIAMLFGYDNATRKKIGLKPLKRK